MNYKITEAFRMTKRRVASNHEKIVSKSLKIGEKSPVDGFSLRLQSNNKPNVDFSAPSRASSRLANKTSPQTKPGTSFSRNKAVTSRSSPRTPRRSPRIYNGLSRVNTTQEFPCSQEQEITWKWDSPAREKPLRSKRNAEKESISDIVQKFVPSLSSSQSSLYDMWRGSCDTTSPNVPIVRRAPIQKPKQKVFLEKQLNQLIEQLNGGRETRSDEVTVNTTKSEEGESSKNEVKNRDDDQRFDWDDEELFNDDSFIARTQEMESNALKQPSSQNVVETTQNCAVESKIDVNNVSARKNDDVFDADWEDDWVFEMVPNATESESRNENKNNDSFSDLFNCPTQPTIQSVDDEEEDLFDKIVGADEDLMEMAFLDTSSDDVFPKVVAAETVGSSNTSCVEVLQNGDSCVIGAGSVSKSVRSNSTIGTLVIAPSTSNAVAEVSSSEAYNIAALQCRNLNLANVTSPVSSSSPPTAFSQQCSPEEIAKKKQAALQRRSLRLANLREVAKTSKSNTDNQKNELNSAHHCTQELIARKREEAIKRRQRRQMER